jgi:hypothetical protein
VKPTPAALAALCLLAAAPAGAVVNPPVLKWQGPCGSFCQTGWYSSPAVSDLDGDGNPEVIWGAYDLFVYQGTTGALRARATNGQRVWPGVAVADLTGDGTKEIVVGRGGNQVHVYRFVPPSSLPVVWSTGAAFPTSGEVRTLAVEDLESDGQLEVIVGRASSGGDRQVNVFNANGAQRPGWPARRPGEEGAGAGMYNENVTVADLDGDGLKEVIAPTDTHYITALHPNGDQILTHPMYDHLGNPGPTPWSRVGVHVDHAVDLVGFANCGTQHRPNFANSAPAIADLDGDGTREIVVPGNVYNCGTSPYTDLYYMPFVLRRDRSRWSGSGFDWTAIPPPGPGSGPLSQDYNVIETAEPNTVLADLDNDGRLEILVPSYDGRLHAWWLDKTEHGAWPFDVPGSGIRFAGEPAVADLDNDGQAEVIFTSWGEKAGSTLGQLHIVSSQGVQLQAVNLPAASGSWNGGLAAPTLADIDGDPDLEAVVGTSHTGVIAYDLPGTANARVLWSTGRGNLKRTGALPVRPTAAVADTAVAEGNAGTASATFAVSLSTPTDAPVSVAYATSPGTATAGTDYVTASGVVTFPPGSVVRTVSVQVAGDLVDEPNETFTLALSAPSGLTIGDGQALATIHDDDAPPNFAAGDCAVVEGDAGTVPCSFAVTLSGPSAFPISVDFFTASGTAISGSDFTALSGSLSFAPGQAGPVVLAPGVLGDTAVEPDESFTLVLQNAVNAALPPAPLTATILDDDAPSPGTDELLHGFTQTGDLAATPDVYRLRQDPYASYEAILDGVTGDAPTPPILQRIAADNVTVLQGAVPGLPGGSHRMAWRNDLPSAVVTQSLRVGGAGCAPACGPDDVYRIRLYETTGSISRFNNSATQTTVLFIQNPSDQAVSARAHFWSASGALLRALPIPLAPRATSVTVTAALPELAGRSGSVTVASDAPYGVLRGKAVALEPATGFAFDDVMRPRPR